VRLAIRWFQFPDRPYVVVAGEVLLADAERPLYALRELRPGRGRQRFAKQEGRMVDVTQPRNISKAGREAAGGVEEGLS
jgi:hypothetical protein